MGIALKGASRTGILMSMILLSFLISGCHTFRRQPVERDVATSRELSLRGLEALNNGRRDAAEELFSQAVEACPRDDRARKRYADALLARGAIDEAISQMEYAIQLSGSDPNMIVQLGEIYLTRGDVELAERLAAEALSKNSQLASAWVLQGRVLERSGDFDNALARYHKALSLQGHDEDVQIMIAKIYRFQGRPLRAYSTLQRLKRESNPGDIGSEVLALQGLALKDLGRHRQASSMLREAIALEPDSSELYAHLAETLFLAGDRANAQIAIAQGRERFPGDRRLAELATRQLVEPETVIR